MFKKIVLLLSVVSVTLLTSSCFTVGDQFPSAVSWIKPHETTRAEIEKAFGPPFRTGYDSGLMTYSYGYYKYSALSDSQTKDLTVRFNDKNIDLINCSIYEKCQDYLVVEACEVNYFYNSNKENN